VNVLAPGEVLFGTSSWSEKTWAGVFYPAGTRPGDYLRYYATRFRTVEVDATYYAVPDRAMAAGWAAKTPAGFTLSAKFVRTIVHGGEASTPDPSRMLRRDEADVFLESMAAVGAKCGPLVLQFPYFSRRAFREAGPFFERLERFLEALPRAFRYAVEVRNAAWLTEELTALLRRHAAALVLVDMKDMPHPAEVAAKLDVVTTDFVYARLIGDRKLTDDLSQGRWDRVIVDQSPRLESWGQLIRTLRHRAPRILVYANNHYAGYAPTTVERLMELVGERVAPVSEWTGGGDPPEQLRLL
jgi:uncharacterized protein YecE (DUF72 family)